MQNYQTAAVAASQGWFVGAPTTRFLAYLTGLSYALIESNGWHDELSFDTNAILYRGQVYRFLTGSLTFQSTGELIVGLLLMVNFSRRFEREMGARKYCVWLLGVMLLSTAFQILLALLYAEGFQYSGPYPTIGALVLMFHMYTPRLHPRFFGMFGLHFSEKTMGYVFCAQIMFYRGYASLAPCLCGAMSAWLMTTFASQLDVPESLASTMTTAFSRFVAEPPAPQIQQQPQRVARPMGTPGPVPREMAAAPMFEQLPPPSESSIEQLTSMGFDREAVLRALQQSHNDVERAADKLLTGS
ncbi:Ubiquitin associated domain [Fragilaria crotonensis]|nr:Ubiquitin associated domain [Fragilaria crotonensis]